jgi:Xaa-Pro aminopeptidase
VRGRKYAVLSALEFGRGKKESGFDVILPLETYLQRARQRWPKRKTGMAEVIALVAAELKQKRFTVPEDFPAGLAARLPALGVKLTIADGPLFPEREIKSAAEAAAIREGNRCAPSASPPSSGCCAPAGSRADRLFSAAPRSRAKG